MTPEEFQDQLKASVSAVRARAKEKNVMLGESTDKFYLGFDRYETTPPERDAAASLGRQLKAIEWVVDQFIANQVTNLKISRIELPEEKGGKGGGRVNPGKPDKEDKGNKGGKPGARPQQELVSYFPFDIVVTGKQARVATALNAIIGDKAPQFLVPRAIRIRNEQPKGPPRAVVAAETADPNAPKSETTVTYIVGDEKIEASLRLEIVDFADMAAK
jgi:hypothetical protein